jgi:hypothetical protein
MPALFDGYGTLLWLVLAFVAVNLIGLLVVGIKFVSQWVFAGFRPRTDERDARKVVSAP